MALKGREVFGYGFGGVSVGNAPVSKSTQTDVFTAAERAGIALEKTGNTITNMVVNNELRKRKEFESVFDVLDKEVEKELEQQRKLDMVKAQSKYTQELVKYKTSILEESDYEKIQQQAPVELKRIQDEATSLIKNKEDRALFAERIKEKASIDSIDIYKTYRKKRKDSNIALFNEQLEKAKDAMPVSNISDFTSNMESMLGLVDSMQEAGEISKTEAYKLKTDVKRELSIKFLETKPADFILENLDIEHKTVYEYETDSISGDFLAKMHFLESSNGKLLNNPFNDDVKGHFQLSSAVAEEFGVKNPYSFDESIKATIKLAERNKTVLRRALNREPEEWELYLAHQQGATGAKALLANPDESAVKVLTRIYGSEKRALSAVQDNGGNAGMTAGEFAELWKNKYDSAPVKAVAVPVINNDNPILQYVDDDIANKLIENARKEKVSLIKDRTFSSLLDANMAPEDAAIIIDDMPISNTEKALLNKEYKGLYNQLGAIKYQKKKDSVLNVYQDIINLKVAKGQDEDAVNAEEMLKTIKGKLNNIDENEQPYIHAMLLNDRNAVNNTINQINNALAQNNIRELKSMPYSAFLLAGEKYKNIRDALDEGKLNIVDEVGRAKVINNMFKIYKVTGKGSAVEELKAGIIDYIDRQEEEVIANDGRRFTNVELKAAFNKAIKQYDIDSFFGTTKKYGYQVEEDDTISFENIDDIDRANIIKRLTMLYGRKPTREEIEQEYMRVVY